jgi:hypothetical protein
MAELQSLKETSSPKTEKFPHEAQHNETVRMDRQDQIEEQVLGGNFKLRHYRYTALLVG